MKTNIFSRPISQLVLLLSAYIFAITTTYAEGEASPPINAAENQLLHPADGAPSADPAYLETTTPLEPEPSLPEMSVPGAATVDDASNAATTAEASTAEAHKGYGLEELWAQGDFVARGTLIIMVIMSAATWYVLVTKLIQQQFLLAQAKTTRKFWQGKTLQDGIATYKENAAFRTVAEDGVTALEQHHRRSGEKLELSEWLGTQLQRSVDRVVSQLQNGLSLLATVGSCSPFVGLFGTVWGIYNALIAIGLSGQASIDKVAGPVGEALIMTAIGLAVAVPAVLGYNWLVRRNKVIVDGLRSFAADIHANLTMGVKGS